MPLEILYLQAITGRRIHSYSQPHRYRLEMITSSSIPTTVQGWCSTSALKHSQISVKIQLRFVTVTPLFLQRETDFNLTSGIPVIPPVISLCSHQEYIP